MSLPQGSIIGTGSERRKSQILRIRPYVVFNDIRGNVETRIVKLDKGGVDAVVLAAAGLKRLGLAERISQFLEPEMVVPAPCQGAVGLECRADDEETLELLELINNPDIRLCVDAERVFIAALGMGCHTPVGAFARLHGDDIIFIVYVMYGEKNEVLRKTCTITKEHVLEHVRELAIRYCAEIEQ